MLYYQRISVQIIKRAQQLSLYHVVAIHRHPVRPHGVVIYIYIYIFMFWSFGTVGFDTFFLGIKVSLNPGLGGVRDVASAIISHE